ncbi:uncharacterized protein (TIGR02099 family) [Tepidicella xavieri]|uniref:Uncharacterized protein (TIGR02099 family) n=1 Tax=Tepidicella xavieri TaxID=360241 RepID=A0A4R6UCH1_9BURK|nr:uncharacterized protein (TIGR02099 family) [Tepidicella xavieri]
MLRIWATLARGLLWLVLAAWLLFGLSWGALHGLIVPRVGEWRPALERLASHALGVPVSIGAVTASSDGPVPSLRLQDVVLRDEEGREALRLAQVRAALSVRSLWRLGFDQLVIEQPVLDIRRTADGRLLLAGIDMGTSDGQGDGRLADWFFAQTEFAIRDGTLRWTDDTRPDAPPLELQAIDFVSRNAGRQHQFRLDATPPAAWGQRLQVQGRFSRPVWQTRAGQVRDWSGVLYAELPWVDMQRLGRYLDTRAAFGVELLQGRGGARLWLDWQRGSVPQIVTDLALGQVMLQWDGAQGPLAVADLRTRLELQRLGAMSRLSTRGLTFLTGEGVRWPGGDIRYQQVQDGTGALTSFELAGERLELAALAQLARHLPLPAEASGWLARTAPQGLADAFRLEWHAAAGARAATWKAEGRLRGLGVQAEPAADPQALGRPGVAGADVVFQATPAGGRADVALNGGHLEFPGVFEAPRLTFDRLAAGIRWTVDGDRIDVEIARLQVANADVEADIRLRWHTADPATSPAQSRFPGVLDLEARLLRADGARVYRYLPQDIPATVRRYLQTAIREGRATDGRFRVRGDLWHFPFDAPGTGAFEVTARLHDVLFDYAPAYLLPPASLGWPGLRVEQARLQIDRTRLVIDDARAVAQAWPGLRVVEARAEIPDFSAEQPRLDVRGLIRAPAQEALAFVERSAVRGMTAGALSAARGSGAVELALELAMPLEDVDATRVRGQVRLTGNDLQITPETPRLQGVQATVQFSESGFEVASATARVLGGPVRFSGRMLEEGGRTRVVFRGQGQVTAEALGRQDHWPWLAPLGRLASGQTGYEIELGVDALGTALRIESGLQGMALDLPPPFDKAAGVVLPLRLSLQPLDSPSPTVPRDELRVELGAGQRPLLSLRYQREDVAGRTRVLRGALAVRSERPALPAQGVRAQIDLDRFDAAAWERVLDGASGLPGGDEGLAYWPSQFSLTAQRIEHAGRVFQNVVAGGTRERDRWRFSVEADELSGYVEYQPNAPQVPGQLFARLARLDLSRQGATEVENLLQAQPEAIPAIDLVVERFRMGGRDLGRLEIQAINRQAVLAARERVREWRLHTLNLAVPEARLRASGNWAASAGDPTGPRRTALRIELDIDDAGLLLSRFGMPDVVRGGKGRIEGHIGWMGSPLSFHAPSLGGGLAIDLERGQFLRADPGIAKLLGVLSLQSLPRRLALDFRDVFSEGFAFDFVRGNARITEGVAHTNNLQMKGVSAAVLMEGQADIVRETQDLTAVVIPELNAGTASLVATVISPVTGLGTFLAQFLLRQPLQEAATRQFRITGSWSDPQVERVNRRNIHAGDAAASPSPDATAPGVTAP